MTSRLVIAVPGTSETNMNANPKVEMGMIGEATKFLSPELFDKYFLPYSAEFGNGTSYHESRDEAVKRLIDMLIDYDGDEIYLIGYSQGAAVVTLAVKTIIQDSWQNQINDMAMEVLNKIKGIYLLANPHRQPGMIYGPDPGGEGIDYSPVDGWWEFMQGKVMEITAPGDIIGSSDPNTTFLKRLPKYLGEMNWTNLFGWSMAVYDLMIKSNPFTLYPELRKELGFFTYLSRYFNTARALYFYINTNVHVHYGTYEVYGQTAVRTIANDIINKAVIPD